MKPLASLSLDLDNLWSYQKVHGDQEWEHYRSYFSTVVPITLDFLKKHDLSITFFVVGKDLENEENHQWITSIKKAGHEFGNHSYHHEPWMDTLSIQELEEELYRTHELLVKVTGQTPIGFRGPGFCHSPNLLAAVHKLGYLFDASLLPTSIGPLARLYYLLKSQNLAGNEKERRKNLFGSFRNAFQPIKPFQWNLKEKRLLEIPVTTIPILRTPFHLSYLFWLSQFSEQIARMYFKLGLSLCKNLGVEPSVLLHPLDFLGKEDVSELSFFPGMNLTRKRKLQVTEWVISEVKKTYQVVSMSHHAKELTRRGNLKSIQLQ